MTMRDANKAAMKRLLVDDPYEYWIRTRGIDQQSADHLGVDLTQCQRMQRPEPK